MPVFHISIFPEKRTLVNVPSGKVIRFLSCKFESTPVLDGVGVLKMIVSRLTSSDGTIPSWRHSTATVVVVLDPRTNSSSSSGHLPTWPATGMEMGKIMITLFCSGLNTVRLNATMDN